MTGTIDANGDYSYGYRVATTSGSHVTLNAAILFSPETVSALLTNPAGGTVPKTVNVVADFVTSFELDAAKFSTADFQALFLLHELGHTLHGLKNDTSGTPAENNQNGLDNDKTVLAHCFK